MSRDNSRILAPVLASVRSGKIGISINSERPFTLEMVEGSVKVTLPEHYLSGHSFRKVRNEITDVNMLRKLAKILSRTSIRVDVFAGSRRIFSMGKGITSLLGNEKVYFVNLLRAAKE